MRAFFNGWRRKMGCFTLVMAVGIGTFCVRSYIIGDSLSLWQLDVTSKQGHVSWAWFPENSRLSVSWRSVNLVSELPSYDKMIVVHYDESIHYGIVTIPLTLLSAYLLLWKPKKQSPETGWETQTCSKLKTDPAIQAEFDTCKDVAENARILPDLSFPSVVIHPTSVSNRGAT